ncbi:hypothetical protein BHE74_00008039 [Ensete ventricosum]|nr:hypothetical protein BHE74_00008039 [Ensete ventricosum]RZR89192.1 hypothetical protein BHM03_00016871 [Ensete ventricosum]
MVSEHYHCTYAVKRQFSPLLLSHSCGLLLQPQPRPSTATCGLLPPAMTSVSRQGKHMPDNFPLLPTSPFRCFPLLSRVYGIRGRSDLFHPPLTSLRIRGRSSAHTGAKPFAATASQPAVARPLPAATLLSSSSYASSLRPAVTIAAASPHRSLSCYRSRFYLLPRTTTSQQPQQ